MRRVLHALLLWAAIERAEAAVGLSLRIPQAETWVLGDAIPLYWRFINPSQEPLGFMWEGCCRLNGRLEVTEAGTGAALETAPVGQALAHMFAKADRLEPGLEKEYDTKVGDWVGLPGTGRYRLQGTYRGVLPTQFPQVPRGLSLWKDAATSAPVELSVMSVADYLAQREARVQRRDVRVTLSGPTRLSPLEPSRFTVVLENLGGAERPLAWPDDMALWVVDAAGRRGAPMAVIPGATTNRVLAPGGILELEFAVAPDRFETEPFGVYSVFVDLAEGRAGEPRVPSNPLSLGWRLGLEDVEALVLEASRGARTGSRNAALKMLRVYLGDVGPELARLDRTRLSAEARGLAERLHLAWRVRPLGLRPGGVDIPVAVSREGTVRWAHPILVEAFASQGTDLGAQVSALLSVRRHLGWDLTLVMEPEAEVTFGRASEAARALAGDLTEWAGPPELRLPVGVTNAPMRLVLSGAARAGGRGPTEVVVVPKPGGGWRLDGLGGAATEGKVATWQRVGVPAAVRWGELRRLLEPHRSAGARWELVLAGPAAGG